MDKLALGETFKDFFHISVPQDMYSMVSNKRTCTLMIFQSRCYPIRSYLSPIRLCFRPNILSKTNFKNSKVTFASNKSMKEQSHI